jgi:DNA-binding CsgD family transcriptional regulator
VSETALRSTSRPVVGDVSTEARLLLESAEHAAKLGCLEWLPGSDEQLWSDNLYRIFGLEPGELTPTWKFVVEQIHPDDRDRVANYVEMSRRIPDPPPIEYRIKERVRGVRYLRSTITTIQSDDRGDKRIIGVVQDVTEQRLANCEIAAHIAVSASLASWTSFDASATCLVRRLAEAMEFVFGALWLPERDVLRARYAWSDASLSEAAEFEAETLELQIPRGVGLVGRAWERHAPIVVTDVLFDPAYLRPKAVAQGELRGAVAFPALHADRVLAVLEFYYPQESRPTARLTQTLSALGNELGEFLSRRQGELRSSPLTRRELQVLQLAADGGSRSEIAERLTVSATTIATHMKHIFENLSVHDRASAVAMGIRLGLIE